MGSDMINLLFQTFRGYGMTHYVYLSGIQFLNPILEPGWYKGKKTFNGLTLNNCNIQRIRRNAFNADIFKGLEALGILSKARIENEVGMLNGLPKLLYLEFSPGPFTGGFDRLLEPLRLSLYTFIYAGFPDDLQFTDLLGNEQLIELHAVALSAMNPNIPRTLMAANFTGLRAVARLRLSHCGIETIADDTFSQIGETLYYIDLTFNRFKTMSYYVFQPFFSRQSEHSLHHKILSIFSNSLKCDCEFLELQSIVYMNVEMKFRQENYYWHRLMNCDGQTSAELPLKCNTVQTITAARMCLSPILGKTYSYIKFKLRVERDVLHITSGAKASFQLWVISLDQPRRGKKSLNGLVEKQSIYCLSLAKATKSVPIGMYLKKSSITSFCIMYLSVDQHFWPFNCITVFQPSNDKQLDVLLMFLIFCGVFIYVNLVAIVGLIIGSGLRQHHLKRFGGIRRE